MSNTPLSSLFLLGFATRYMDEIPSHHDIFFYVDPMDASLHYRMEGDPVSDPELLGSFPCFYQGDQDDFQRQVDDALNAKLIKSYGEKFRRIQWTWSPQASKLPLILEQYNQPPASRHAMRELTRIITFRLSKPTPAGKESRTLIVYLDERDKALHYDSSWDLAWLGDAVLAQLPMFYGNYATTSLMGIVSALKQGELELVNSQESPDLMDLDNRLNG